MYTATVSLDDATVVTDLDLSSEGFTGATGIETLTTLVTLNIGNTKITTFDLTLPDSITSLSLSSNSLLTAFDPPNPLPTSLYELHLNYNTQITTFDPTIPLPSSLKILDLSNNEIVTFDPTLALPDLDGLNLGNNQIVTFDPSNNPLPTTLVNLFLNNNQISVFNPINNSLPSSLNNLDLSHNLITYFSPTSFTLPSTITQYGLQYNSLSNTEIDNTLQFFTTVTFDTPTSVYLNLLNQVGDSCLDLSDSGSTGYMAYEALTGNGVNIQVSICPSAYAYNYSISQIDIDSATGNTVNVFGVLPDNRVYTSTTNDETNNPAHRIFTASGSSYIHWMCSKAGVTPTFGYYQDDVLITDGLNSVQTKSGAC
jgi:hypothetical protein